MLRNWIAKQMFFISSIYLYKFILFCCLSLFNSLMPSLYRAFIITFFIPNLKFFCESKNPNAVVVVVVVIHTTKAKKNSARRFESASGVVVAVCSWLLLTQVVTCWNCSLSELGSAIALLVVVIAIVHIFFHFPFYFYFTLYFVLFLFAMCWQCFYFLFMPCHYISVYLHFIWCILRDTIFTKLAFCSQLFWFVWYKFLFIYLLCFFVAETSAVFKSICLLWFYSFSKVTCCCYFHYCVCFWQFIAASCLYHLCSSTERSRWMFFLVLHTILLALEYHICMYVGVKWNYLHVWLCGFTYWQFKYFCV